jgi:hypothetical protein
MSTRKPKLPEMYPVDDPAKQLQLITVSYDTARKASAYSRAWQADESAQQRCLAHADKRRLH